MSSKLTRRKRKHLTGYNSLEQRRLLAGDVSVVESGHLFFRGDQADNQIEIVVVGDELRINGLNGTTINRQDSYVVRGATVTESGVLFEGGLRGNLGPGHDDLEIRDAIFGASSNIYGGLGDDQIDVIDSQFRDRTVIQTFDGADSVSTSGSQFDGDFYAITLNGRDAVSSVDTVFNGFSIVATGEHADAVHSEGNQYTGEVNLILSQNGNDEVQLIDPAVGEDQLGVFLGNHDDTIHLYLEDASVDSTLRIAGQAGIDETPVTLTSDGVANKTTVWGFEKGELLFESNLGGIENVTEGASTALWTVEPGVFEDGIETSIAQYATPVSVESTQTIRSLDWTGTYSRDYFREDLEEITDRFVIEIFEDAGDGAPDIESVARFNVGEANRTVVGEVTLDYYGTTPLYGYHAEVEYTLEAGKQYWVSIYTELEYVDEANVWEWGLGVSNSGAGETLYNQGDNIRQNNWRNGDRPWVEDILQLDLRVRG